MYRQLLFGPWSCSDHRVFGKLGQSRSTSQFSTFRHCSATTIQHLLDIIVNFDDDEYMRYPGGKGKCFQHLVNLMPPHVTYIESHLGGGAIMRNKLPACRNIGIDLDPRALSLCRNVEIPGLELHEQDAVEFLKTFTFTGQELVYADPPYLQETRRRQKIYRCEYTEEHHVELLEMLCTLPCHVMVSGYDNALYRERLAGWRRVTFQAKSHGGVREESVWMNFAEPSVLHDARYLGSNFRERQAIRRRQETLHKRMYAMSSVERHEFFRWLNEAFPGSSVEGLCNAHS